jgi:hypothetical protein
MINKKRAGVNCRKRKYCIIADNFLFSVSGPLFKNRDWLHESEFVLDLRRKISLHFLAPEKKQVFIPRTFAG